MKMSHLVLPEGGEVLSRLLKGEELAEERKRARELPAVHMTSRETSDLIMIGIGAFSPLDGFMGREGWEGI
jgi:sulfate adenylyltransferase